MSGDTSMGVQVFREGIGRLPTQESLPIECVLIEAPEDRSLRGALAGPLNSAFIRMSRGAAAKELARRARRALAGFVGAMKLTFDDIAFSLDVEKEEGVADSGDLDADLTMLMQVTGEAARARATALVLFVDRPSPTPSGCSRSRRSDPWPQIRRPGHWRRPHTGLACPTRPGPWTRSCDLPRAIHTSFRNGVAPTRAKLVQKRHGLQSGPRRHRLHGAAIRSIPETRDAGGLMNDSVRFTATLPANRPRGKCSWTLLVMAGLAASHVAGSDRSLQT